MTNDSSAQPPEGARPAAGDASPPVQAARAAAAAAQQMAGEGQLAGGHGTELEALSAEVAALKIQLDQAKRAWAELDNIRKRNEREKEEVAKYAITKFARDALTIGDNLQRAIATVPPGAVEADPAMASFHEGVLLTERELTKVFERNGIKRIEPRGEAFNPHQHQAVVEIPAPEVLAGTIIEVFQPGYVIEDRVLRPAMVAVAKGGAKAAPPPQAAANDDGPDGHADAEQREFGKRPVPPESNTSQA